MVNAIGPWVELSFAVVGDVVVDVRIGAHGTRYFLGGKELIVTRHAVTGEKEVHVPLLPPLSVRARKAIVAFVHSHVGTAASGPGTDGGAA